MLLQVVAVAISMRSPSSRRESTRFWGEHRFRGGRHFMGRIYHDRGPEYDLRLPRGKRSSEGQAGDR